MADLTDFPRADVGGLTPLHLLSRLSTELGVEIWAKRDDVGTLGLGGNKLRKLEFLLGDALSHGCDTVVTFGAVQSNHARQTAAACAHLGLDCHLVLTRSVDRAGELYATGGNVLLDHLFGAELHTCDDTDDALATAIAEVEEATDGRAVRWIPPGGSEPIGALGYAAVATELAGQCRSSGLSPSRIVLATSTGGTQAGLLSGVRLPEAAHLSDCAVHGVAVYHPAASTREAVTLLEAGTAELLGIDPAPADDVHVDDAQLGDGYGVPTDASVEALELLGRLEGIALDPVYTAKAAAGLIADCRAGRLDRPVVFLHTGGSPALFAYGR